MKANRGRAEEAVAGVEESRATTKEEQEIAKITAEAAMKPVADVANKLFGGAVEEIGGMWQDYLKVRRFERQLKLLLRIQELIAQAGFEPRQIKDSISLPLLNAATLEDDEKLQQAWACLIANAANPAANVHPAFIQILESMAPLDAVVLDLTYKRLLSEMKTKGNFQIVFLENAKMQEVLRIARENGGDTSLENLIRLRLVETAPEWTDPSSAKMRPTHRYYITKLGQDFYIACRPPELRESLLGRK